MRIKPSKPILTLIFCFVDFSRLSYWLRVTPSPLWFQRAFELSAEGNPFSCSLELSWLMEGPLCSSYLPYDPKLARRHVKTYEFVQFTVAELDGMTCAYPAEFSGLAVWRMDRAWLSNHTCRGDHLNEARNLQSCAVLLIVTLMKFSFLY